MFNCVIPGYMTVSAFLICLIGALVDELTAAIRDYLDNVKLDQFVRNTPESEGKVPAGENWNCGL